MPGAVRPSARAGVPERSPVVKEKHPSSTKAALALVCAA
ncbi:MAG: hypothetical protein AVDCRST_MAG27-480 [uncultured Craurococcus sp.]|uniref:Uncharacterized protein n=1 Tax=uncultured Craurococcus sp. TaxID=1135998 RepID=A0A6J4HEA2_9PROT|nr:MAG: hypothetical protein AVDCRST_MAG27-480 [uncultured Craurococcus sp.]